MTEITIIRNAVTAQVIRASDEVKTIIQEALSYEVESGFGRDAWAGTSTFFSWQTGKFPAGFCDAVASRLKRKGFKTKIHRKEVPPPLGMKNPVVNDYPKNPFYDYQDETVERLVERKGIIGQCATGGGKSEIACKAYGRVQRLTLFLTTRGVLMHQMKRNFEKSIAYQKKIGTLPMSTKVGIMGDSEFSPSKYINVATVQTLSAAVAAPNPEWSGERKRKHAVRRDIVLRLLSATTLLILEEAHEASGGQFYRLACLCKNADYRLALTATPFMRSSSEQNMRLLAASGSIGIKVTEKYLIDAGILATPYFKYIDMDYAPDDARIMRDLKGKYLSNNLAMSAQYQRAYQLGIVYNRLRNAAIVDESVKFRNAGLSTMILVKHKNHGKILAEMLEEKGVKAAFIFGESSQKLRDENLRKLRDGEIDVLIGSTILDVGVDVPSVGAVIIAGSGKAEVELRQRIGRGLRAKKRGENVCYIVDFKDRVNKHLLKHSFERRAIIESTDGFKNGIIPACAEFTLPKREFV